jgi:hypothetical protein
VKSCIGDLSRVHVVQGWFCDSLAKDNPGIENLDSVAIAWIDCDLYESTIPVLEFLNTRVQNGSLIFFDDWFCFKGRPDCGEQRACKEWLQQNPNIQLIDYVIFGWRGKSFIAHVRG